MVKHSLGTPQLVSLKRVTATLSHTPTILPGLANVLERFDESGQA